MANYTLTQTGQEVQNALNTVGKTVTYSITDLFTNQSKIQTVLGAAMTPGNNYLIVAFDLNPLTNLSSDVNTIVIDLTTVGYNTQMTYKRLIGGSGVVNQFGLTTFAQSGTDIATVNQYLVTSGYYTLTSDLHTATIIQ